MDTNKTIQFIDSDYRELFRIPDGGSVKITFPPGDIRGFAVRECKYLDDTHFEIKGNGSDIYHQCQFAELMEKMGAKYEPAVQLRNIELRAIEPGEEKYCTYNREEGNTCVGHIAGDFGHDGDRFHYSWSDRDNGRNTPEFQTELHSAVYALRYKFDFLKSHSSMRAFCDASPEAKLPGRNDLEHYGFKLDTANYQYFILCVAERQSRDSRVIIYAYDKIAPALEQEQPAIGNIQPRTSDEKNMFYRNDKEGNLCVGYMRGDFGKNGGEFRHNWFDGDKARNTPEFKAEFQDVINTLRQDILKDHKSSSAYCHSHLDAKLQDGDGHRFGFKLETDRRQYFVRCTTLRDDYFYVFAYDKAASREQARSAGDKPSVMEQIREARSAPKPPAKPKPEHGRKKDGPEL